MRPLYLLLAALLRHLAEPRPRHARRFDRALQGHPGQRNPRNPDDCFV